MTTGVLAPVILDGMEEFLGLLAGGTGPRNAAIAVGWSLHDLSELERNPQFVQACNAARGQLIESIELKSAELALAGNVPMIQMWLFCHGADKGWRPPAQRVNVQHQGVITVERIGAAKAALLELIDEHGTDVLAVGGPLDPKDEIVDAEIVE